MDHKPSLFIASSVESLNVAYAVQENLQHDAEVTVWAQGSFELSKSTLESLLEIVKTMDFGVFVFGADDVLKWKQADYKVVRDNVLFELGLFVGKLGRERSFIIQAAGVEDFHLPTDLVGVTPARYDPKRRDGNVKAALGPACNQIRRAIEKHGHVMPTQALKPQLKQLGDASSVQGTEIVFEAQANAIDEIKISHADYVQAVDAISDIRSIIDQMDAYPLLVDTVYEGYDEPYKEARTRLMGCTAIISHIPVFISASIDSKRLMNSSKALYIRRCRQLQAIDDTFDSLYYEVDDAVNEEVDGFISRIATFVKST